MPDEELGRLRKKIDDIDDEILYLLTRRLEVARAIGKVKKPLGLEVTDSAREREVLGRIREKVGQGLPVEAIQKIFREIMAAAREVQQIRTSNHDESAKKIT